MTAVGWRALLPSRADYAGLRGSWRADLLAGVTVGIVALPLALAFGVSSGAGAEAGLVTAIVAGVVAAVFGGSPVQVSGPTGAMVVVLAPVLAARGATALALVTVLAGVMVIALGVSRLGRLVGLIPWPVLEGFTLGIAIIIFLQQVPAAIGVPAGGHGSNAAAAAVDALLDARVETAWPALAMAAAVAAIMVVMPRLTRAVPGSIVAVVVVSVAAVTADAAGLFAAPVPSIGALPAGLPAPGLALPTLAEVTSLLAPAATIAALAAIESLLSARVAASQTGGGYDADRELVGQGLASVAAGLFGGMPATGAIARTAVNVRAGARTRLAAVVHGVVLLAVVAVASGVVSRIPLAVLAGVLMVTAISMVHRRTVAAVMRGSRQGAVVFVLTAIVTVSVDLIYAVGIGMAVAAFLALRAVSNSAGVHREELPGGAHAGDEWIALLRLDGALFFGAAERVLERVSRVEGARVVILRMSQVDLLDATGAQLLAEVIASLRRQGVTVLLKGIRPEHRRVLLHAGALEEPRVGETVFETLDGAVARARELVAG